MNYTPSLLLATASIIFGLLLLVAGGESLVHGSTRLAKRFGVPSFIIGLTVVAFGTSVPELFISLIASLQGHPNIMIGNIIGSNIANVGLIMGICALLVPLELKLQNIKTELLIVLSASVFLMLCSGYQSFPRSAGFIFIATLISYTCFMCLNHQQERTPATEVEASGSTSLLLMAATIIAGLLLLAFGSKVFIQGAVEVARHFGISELIIGLTLAAIGTSLPELASSLAALRQKETGLLIGNIIGSNMFNLLMVLGLTGLIKPFSMDQNLLYRDLPVMTIFTLLLIPILLKDGKTKKWQGAMLLTGYVGYCFSLL